MNQLDAILKFNEVSKWHIDYISVKTEASTGKGLWQLQSHEPQEGRTKQKSFNVIQLWTEQPLRLNMKTENYNKMTVKSQFRFKWLGHSLVI